MSPPSVESEQDAVDRLQALHRHGDGQHQLVLLVDPFGAGRCRPSGRVIDLAIDPTVIAGFEIGTEMGEGAHAHQPS